MTRPGKGRRSSPLSLEQLEDRLVLSTAATNVVVPNDPQFSTQYALQNTGQNNGTPGADINAAGAWTLSTGSASVTVAVLDSGIDYDHPDLYKNIWINQAEIPKSRLQNLVDVDHDNYISFADLNNPINQGVGKVQKLDGAPFIDASDILAPMQLDAQGRDTGLGGWAYSGNTQDGDTAHPNDFIGWNFVADNNNPMDDNGHGTNISGAIGAVGNNGTGIAGVAWSTSLMAVKFIDAQGSGTPDNLIAAIRYATRHGAQILNNSWGGVDNWPNLLSAIQATQTAQEIFVVAAGNGAANLDQTASYPASFPVGNLVGVAATDNTGALASFSNYGANSVALAAPGVSVVSTYPGKSYNQNTGTSISAPLVSGILALVWSQHPDWTYTQVINDVVNTATKTTALQGKIKGGLVNAAAALGWTATSPPVTSPPPATSPPPPVTTTTAPASIVGTSLLGTANTISTLQVTLSESVDPGTFTTDDVVFRNAAGVQIVAQSVTVVANSNNMAFNIVFPTQTAAGTYSLKIGPEVFDALQRKMIVFQTTLTIAPPSSVPGPTDRPQIVSSTVLGGTTTTLLVQVTFNKSVDPVNFTPDDVVFTDPNGRQVAAQAVAPVANTVNTIFNIYFPAQTVAGTYSLKIGPEVFDYQQNKMIVYQTALTISSAMTPPPVTPPAPNVPPSILSLNSLSAPNTISTLQVTFSKPVLAETFTADDVFFYGPGGQRIVAQSVTPVAGSNNTVFNIVFATQAAIGVYSLKIGPEVFDAQQSKMIVFQTTVTLSSAVNVSSNTQLAIVPGSGASSAVRVNQSLSIQAVTVTVNLTFPNDGNLVLILQAPDGSNVLLSNLRGGNGQNYQGTTFSDTAATAISAGSAPFTGTYQPESPLVGIAGKNANGLWTLLIEDKSTSLSGTLNSWSLSIVGH